MIQKSIGVFAHQELRQLTESSIKDALTAGQRCAFFVTVDEGQALFVIQRVDAETAKFVDQVKLAVFGTDTAESVQRWARELQVVMLEYGWDHL